MPGIFEFKVDVQFPKGSSRILPGMTCKLEFVVYENEKVVRETEETFDDENVSTGRSETIYTYDTDGNLTSMTYDDLEHGSSLIEAVVIQRVA